jgi:hypothetical protein
MHGKKPPKARQFALFYFSIDMLTPQEHTATMKLSDEAREYFRKMGGKGGKIRKEKLSAKRRKQIAKKAAKARWRK